MRELTDEPNEFEPGTTFFTGVERTPDGRTHNVSRLTCNGCGVVLSQMHYGCCGHASCGFGSYHHVCEKGNNGEMGL